MESAIDNADAQVDVTTAVTERTFQPPALDAAGVLLPGQDDSYSQAAAPEGANTSVITDLYKGVGDSVSSGDAIMEVSGRPIILLDLPFTLYRDIAPGDEGTDVRALQETLQGIGLYDGAFDGIYGARTAAAMEDLYSRQDLEPPPVETSLLDAQEAAEAEARRVSEQDGDASLRRASELTLQRATFNALPPVRQSEVVRMTAPEGTLTSLSTVGVLVGEGGEDTASAPLFTIRYGSPQAILRVPVGNEAAFTIGSDVQLSDPSGQTFVGRVTNVGDFTNEPLASTLDPAPSQVDLPGFDVTVALAQQNDDAFPDSAVSVVAKPVDGAGDTESLAVPVSALRTQGDTTFVSVARGSNYSTVGVTVSSTQDGYAAITPVDEGALSTSDEVLISE